MNFEKGRTYQYKGQSGVWFTKHSLYRAVDALRIKNNFGDPVVPYSHVSKRMVPLEVACSDRKVEKVEAEVREWVRKGESPATAKNLVHAIKDILGRY